MKREVFFLFLLFSLSFALAETCYKNSHSSPGTAFAKVTVCGGYDSDGFYSLSCSGDRAYLYEGVSGFSDCTSTGCGGSPVSTNYNYYLKDGNNKFCYGCWERDDDRDGSWAWASNGYCIGSHDYTVVIPEPVVEEPVVEEPVLLDDFFQLPENEPEEKGDIGLLRQILESISSFFKSLFGGDASFVQSSSGSSGGSS